MSRKTLYREQLADWVEDKRYQFICTDCKARKYWTEESPIYHDVCKACARVRNAKKMDKKTKMDF